MYFFVNSFLFLERRVYDFQYIALLQCDRSVSRFWKNLTNLNRQQYSLEHVGMYKTDALKAQLLHINPYLSIRTDCVRVNEQNLRELFLPDDIICEAFDQPEAKATLVSGILEHFPEKRLVAASGLAGHSRCGYSGRD